MRQRRIIHSTIAAIVLLISANSVIAQKRKQAIRKPLVLKVTTTNSVICLGTKSIILRVEMSNVSRRPVTIDKKYLWNGSVSVFFRNKNVVDGWASGGAAQYPYTGDFLQLAPGEQYRESKEFAFTEDGKLEDFFNRVGQYTLTVRYEADDLDHESSEIRKWLYTKPVFSNLKFQIVQCQQNK